MMKEIEKKILFEFSGTQKKKKKEKEKESQNMDLVSEQKPKTFWKFSRCSSL